MQRVPRFSKRAESRLNFNVSAGGGRVGTRGRKALIFLAMIALGTVVSVISAAPLLPLLALAVDPNLMAHWTLDEGTGQIVNDSSASSNNGILGTIASSDPGDPTWTTGTSPSRQPMVLGQQVATLSASRVPPPKAFARRGCAPMRAF